MVLILDIKTCPKQVQKKKKVESETYMSNVVN